ncbi:MAG: LytTR family DNA-binding domain-containing protein [Bacteroidota bacterium]
MPSSRDQLNCLIVDDEPLAREGLAGYVAKIPFLKLVGVAENAFEAMEMIHSHEIDLMMLDIHMPELTGIEFLKSLTDPPIVVFTTAYPSYALEGYQLDVLDYLVKPISFDRFMRAATKARDFHALRLKAQAVTPSGNEKKVEAYFFVKCDHKLEKIQLKELLFIESMQNYVGLYTPKGRLVTLATLKSMAEQLPDDRFIQVHKSYLVAMEKVDGMEGNQLLIGEFKVPVGRSYKEMVMSRLINGRLLGK